MKILFLIDYFTPFVHGGAEISVLEMAKAISQRSHQIHILTPNYGAFSEENMEGIFVHRYFFPTNLKTFTSQLSFIWHFNPIYWTILLLVTVKAVKQFHIQIIHCQSAASVIPGVLAGRLLNKPTVITFRDGQVLCNYGYCLTKNQFGKTCNIVDYFLEDFRHYYEDKTDNKSLLNFSIQIISSIQGRLRDQVLELFAHFCNVRIVNSSAAQKTFKINDFPDVQVINNIYNFPSKVNNQLIENKSILYATKLSTGKGLDLLLPAFKIVLNKYPQAKLKIMGDGSQKKYKKMAKKLKIDQSTKFLTMPDYSRVRLERRNSLLEVIPSIYPESFGRAALEALANGIPVVATNRGGLTDIVKNGKTGFIVEPTIENIAEGILSGIKLNKVLRQNIRENYPELIRKFQKDPVEKQIILYKNLL